MIVRGGGVNWSFGLLYYFFDAVAKWGVAKGLLQWKWLN